MTALHEKHRPASFDEVVGQDDVVKSLSAAIEHKRSQAFLFGGPSGCGKTTLARIAAMEAGCDPNDIISIDAATHTGVDSVRDIQEMIRFKPMRPDALRALIIDECHMLSKAAWNALLLVLEEPPKHILWFLCTTEMGKIITTIKTRCMAFNVKLLNEKDLRVICTRVLKAEKITMLPEVVDLVISKAFGSPRQMLVNIATCQEAKSRKEAAQLLQVQLEGDPIIELCRFITKKQGSWAALVEKIDALEVQNAESIRIMLSNYIGACLKGSKTDKDAVFFLQMLEEFATPYPTYGDNMSLLYLSLGRVWFSGGE